MERGALLREWEALCASGACAQQSREQERCRPAFRETTKLPQREADALLACSFRNQRRGLTQT